MGSLLPPTVLKNINIYIKKVPLRKSIPKSIQYPVMNSYVLFLMLVCRTIVALRSPCTLPGVEFVWLNGQVGESQNVANDSACEHGCYKFPGCAGWTYNKNNQWCGYKGANQIKPRSNAGFV